jgi:hypothetical protein
VIGNQIKTRGTDFRVVLLPGFQKGRDIMASKGKGQGAVLIFHSEDVGVNYRSST